MRNKRARPVEPVASAEVRGTAAVPERVEYASVAVNRWAALPDHRAAVAAAAVLSSAVVAEPLER